MINNQELNQEIDIENFKQYFLKKYNKNIHITTVKLLKSQTLSLETFSICTLKAIHNNESNCEDITTLKNKSRKRPYILYTQAMAYMAFQQGYNKSNIGKHIDRHHGTIISSIKQIENYFYTNELMMLNVYSNIIKEIKLYVGNVPKNIEKQTDTQSSIYAVWNKTENSRTN
jgi:hypothetical protein